MVEENKYFIVKKKALPEVLLKVVEANRLLEGDRDMTVQEAIDRVGISRSSFYKYKDDILPFRDNAQGRTITFMMVMDDVPGLLSMVLKLVAEYEANVLTILQAIPVNGVASLTISIEVLPTTKNVAELVAHIEALEGIHELRILARE